LSSSFLLLKQYCTSLVPLPFVFSSCGEIAAGDETEEGRA